MTPEVGQKVWVVSNGECHQVIVHYVLDACVTGSNDDIFGNWQFHYLYATADEAAEALRSEAREMLRRADEIEGVVLPEGWKWSAGGDWFIVSGSDYIAHVYSDNSWLVYTSTLKMDVDGIAPDLETAKRDCLRAALKHRENANG